MKKMLTILAVVIAIAFTANAQKLGVQGTLALPMGDFGDVAGMGFGGVGTYFYETDGAFIITGSIGFHSFAGKDAADGWSWSIIPIMAGARYALGEGSSVPYVGVEAGYSLYSLTTDIGGVSVSGSDNNLGLAPMLGFMMEMSKGLNLDLNAKYQMILTSGSTTSYVSVNAGVVFEL